MSKLSLASHRKMELSFQRLILFLCSAIVLFNTVNGLTCGPTKCKDGEHCCSKTDGEPKNCCCTSGLYGYSIDCYSSTNSSPSGPPWYGLLITMLVVLAIAGGRRHQLSQS